MCMITLSVNKRSGLIFAAIQSNCLVKKVIWLHVSQNNKLFNSGIDYNLLRLLNKLR